MGSLSIAVSCHPIPSVLSGASISGSKFPWNGCARPSDCSNLAMYVSNSIKSNVRLSFFFQMGRSCKAAALCLPCWPIPRNALLQTY